MTQNLEEGRRAAGYCRFCRRGYAVGPHVCSVKDALHARSEVYGADGKPTEAAEVARAAFLEIERLERLAAPPVISEENRKAAEHLIKLAKERGDIIAGDDGFYIYWPCRPIGAVAAHELRILADELDRMNEPWQAQIDQYFRENPADKSVCAAIQPSGENARLMRLGGSRYMCTREHGHSGAHGKWMLVSQVEHAEAQRTHRMPEVRFVP